MSASASNLVQWKQMSRLKYLVLRHPCPLIRGSGFTSNQVVSGPPADDTYWACGSELFVNPANARLKATVKGTYMKTASAAPD